MDKGQWQIFKIKGTIMRQLFLLLFIFTGLFAQEKNLPDSERDSLIAAAREIIAQQRYCALATIDSSGHPDVRTMNPFPPEDDMSVWMATNSRSHKVQEIRNNPKVCLYYGDHSKAVGYVTITGTAILVDDMNEKLKRKRDYWSQSFPDWKYLILIKVVPERMEVVNYKYGKYGEVTTWSAPIIVFKKQQ
jgi:general stress protein 26